MCELVLILMCMCVWLFVFIVVISRKYKQKTSPSLNYNLLQNPSTEIYPIHRTLQQEQEKVEQNVISPRSASLQETISHLWRDFCTKYDGRYAKFENKSLDFEEQRYGVEYKSRTQSDHNVEVQVYVPQKLSYADKFYGELFDRINQQCDLTIHFNEIERLHDVKLDEPLLVICMNMSRLGTDALNAIKGVPEPTPSVLLIFHHKDDHSLPVTPSSRILSSSEFVKLHGIYDIACLKDRGVYQCDMNSKAIRNIVQFIRSYNRNESRISHY